MTHSRTSVLSSFSGSIRGIDSPRKLAMGLAIGALIGILPKDNILVAGLLVFLILSVSNLVTGAIAGISTALLSPLMQHAFHQTGQAILKNEFVATAMASFLEFPLAAWTALDNTVVCGSLAIGVIAILPIYFCSFHFFSRYRDTIRLALSRSGLTNWILGYPAQETQHSRQ